VTKEQILARIDAVIASAAQRQPEDLLNAALTIMIAVYGDGSRQVKTLLNRWSEICKAAYAHRSGTTQAAVRGVLKNLREEIEAGLLASIEQRITSDVLSDFVHLARTALETPGDDTKNVAAVLAAAAYEDTLRRIARDHAGLIGRDDLADVITHLKNAGILVAPQLSIVQGHLNFRNHALHANWEKIDRTAVGRALGLVEALLIKHFS
jgi:hypothetical protein